MNKLLRIGGFGLLLSLSLAACHPEPAEVQAEVVATVVVEPARAGSFQESLDAYGTVRFAPDQLRIVDSAAELSVEQILVSPGQTVALGELLLRIKPTANSALELGKAQSDLAFAEQSQTRTARLFAQHLATNADLDLARQNSDNAKASLANVRARVGNAAGEVRAPAAGVVASVDVARGAIVAAGTPLLHLADRGQLQVRIGIEPADLPRLRAGLTVSVDAAYDGKLSSSARLDQLVGQIDSQSRMAEAIIEIPQGTGLLPGATVHAHIALAQRSGVLTVPHAAVLYADERAYVYLLEGGLARQAWVGAGQQSGERIEIQSGIKEGDLVVVEGNYVLEEGMRAVVAGASTVSTPLGSR